MSTANNNNNSNNDYGEEIWTLPMNRFDPHAIPKNRISRYIKRANNGNWSWSEKPTALPLARPTRPPPAPPSSAPPAPPASGARKQTKKRGRKQKLSRRHK